MHTYIYMYTYQLKSNFNYHYSKRQITFWTSSFVNLQFNLKDQEKQNWIKLIILTLPDMQIKHPVMLLKFTKI